MSDLPTTEADILKAFPQPTCLKILEFLSDGERCVCEISPGKRKAHFATKNEVSLLLL